MKKKNHPGMIHEIACISVIISEQFIIKLTYSEKRGYTKNGKLDAIASLAIRFYKEFEKEINSEKPKWGTEQEDYESFIKKRILYYLTEQEQM